MNRWPPITYETIPWCRDDEERSLIPKARLRRIRSTYEAAIPLEIAGRDMGLSQEVLIHIAETSAEIARFDAEQNLRAYNLPALLLRSESAASSQIERLNSSVRNVALAELSDDAPSNAKLIVGNIKAMRAALSLPGGIDANSICEIHRILMASSNLDFGGELREEQVWIGGTPYSPHDALFVPPAAARVPAYLDDLEAFSARDDVNPIAKAAIVHAQFETIHPFIDGNGRTGRTLLHRVLRKEGLLNASALPISAGLLNSVDAYMGSLNRFHEGDYEAIIEQLIEALERAMVVGRKIARNVDAIINTWEETIVERKGAAIHRLPALLVEQPIINAAFVSCRLGITKRAARDLIERACGYGILSPTGNRRRGVYYQASEMIEALEEVSSMSGIRRVLAR